jgi:8-oxo-dGTP diphosphatase
MTMRIPLLLTVLSLAACGGQAPSCITPEQPQQAPSAGCFAMKGGNLLVVETLSGLVNLPGGSSNDNEHAQCTAHRETWEETGLDLEVGELLKVMDTGFHLYHCSFKADSGDIDPPPRLEVRRAYLLAPEKFKDQNWRFSGQDTALVEMAKQL